MDRLKAKLGSRLERFTVDRLYRPDMVVLLIALYELERGDTPAKVVVNEAVDLAQKYGTEKSGGFVNGVLAKFVRRDPAPDESAKKDENDRWKHCFGKSSFGHRTECEHQGVS